MDQTTGSKFELETILHTLILKHAYPQFRDGHLRSAVLDAFIAVFDIIRERTGLRLDGAELVGKAFSLSEPWLIVSELDTESGRSDQKGFIQLLQGAYLSVRNPKAHSLQSDLDAISAAQYLVFASLLARRVEAATPGNILRFDGLYMAAGPDPGDQQYLRFYEDGEVLMVSTESDEDADDDVLKIMRWLTKENGVVKDFPRGTYTQNGNRIEFSAKSRSGEVVYQGEIRGETLQLCIHSRANGRRSEREFTFKAKR